MVGSHKLISLNDLVFENLDYFLLTLLGCWLLLMVVDRDRGKIVVESVVKIEVEDIVHELRWLLLLNTFIISFKNWYCRSVSLIKMDNTSKFKYIR